MKNRGRAPMQRLREDQLSNQHQQDQYPEIGADQVL